MISQLGLRIIRGILYSEEDIDNKQIDKVFKLLGHKENKELPPDTEAEPSPRAIQIECSTCQCTFWTSDGACPRCKKKIEDEVSSKPDCFSIDSHAMPPEEVCFTCVYLVDCPHHEKHKKKHPSKPACFRSDQMKEVCKTCPYLAPCSQREATTKPICFGHKEPEEICMTCPYVTGCHPQT